MLYTVSDVAKIVNVWQAMQTRVSGPLNMSILKKRDVTVVLFGDVHIQGGCRDPTAMHVGQYILTVIKAAGPKKVVDVFLESAHGAFDARSPISHVSPKQHGTIVETIDMFFANKCLVPNPSKCAPANGRIHQADARQLCGERYFGALERAFKGGSGSATKKIPMWGPYISEVKRALGCERIVKQWVSCDASYKRAWGKRLSKFVQDADARFAAIWDGAVMGLRRAPVNDNIDADMRRHLVGTLRGIMITVETQIMDTYLVGRLLRKFRPKNKRRHHSDRVKNAIVYAGSFHTDNIVAFLLENGFKTVSHASAQRSLCVKVPSPEVIAESFS
jgi:hypothetical protein